jgi:hypothetical protein
LHSRSLARVTSFLALACAGPGAHPILLELSGRRLQPNHPRPQRGRPQRSLEIPRRRLALDPVTHAPLWASTSFDDSTWETVGLTPKTVSFDPVHQLRRFVLQFRAMLRWRNANKLCTWIEAASASHFRFLAQFASTLRGDLKAVELSITTPWSNGPIEGHINRLKAIKRQMYGRAGFELLKARVLPWDVPQAA